MTLFEIVESFGVRPEIPLFERSEFRNFLIFLFLFVSRQKEKIVETQKIMIIESISMKIIKKPFQIKWNGFFMPIADSRLPTANTNTPL
jgi:hypothetical protein